MYVLDVGVYDVQSDIANITLLKSLITRSSSLSRHPAVHLLLNFNIIMVDSILLFYMVKFPSRNFL